MTTFAKGHGTENDFVLLDDPDGGIDLTPELIRRLADRRAGLGADGVIRVVRSAAAGQDPSAEWFMDYWNSDAARPRCAATAAGSSWHTFCVGAGSSWKTARMCGSPPGVA